MSLDFDTYIDIHSNYQCSPAVFAKKKNIIDPRYKRNNNFATCFRKKDLISMIRSYNKYHSKKGDLSIINLSKRLEDLSKYDLWNALDTQFKSVCDDEVCWINQPTFRQLPKDNYEFVKDLTFKPPRPTDDSGNTKNAWLSNEDIEKVMKQYEKIYPDFKFMGPYPIDFAKHFNYYGFNENMIQEFIKQDFRRIGIVFNTGTLSSGGIHWVALYINLKDALRNGYYTVEFFDSVGTDPQREIGEIICTLVFNQNCKNRVQYDKYTKNIIKIKNLSGGSDNNISKCAKTLENFVYKTKIGDIELIPLVNKISHQQGNNECGVYCTYFITERLKGKSFFDIVCNKMKDAKMNKFRHKFFRSK